MTINKELTTQKEEESIFSVFQKLFLRRPDITPDIRLDLAISSLGPQYRNCKIWELEARYKICHTFIYKQGNICLLYTSPSPRDRTRSRMPSSA